MIAGSMVGWFVTLASHPICLSGDQGPTCVDNFTSCHTEIGVADQTF